ncbi:MAG: FAD/NAD(P)-binding oxidoreductase [Acidimicrobiales bacterium]|nr:FAD/NAD(P)-binding oxidoreductase [Acidimicrobiales bacterium]MDP6239995.1 FAD/NAD(P)-binding oxidoreductase [Acidimicrobiales bacterium]MDP7125543.1 FAD/NAD(P)-binding oxidoreductase [Acidimicrobiales bacterium]MDP7351921.1 FAD/NAD(P)-binding oxidoreductase [Acidimicrobiales bacterium]MDP7508920.1 FAD/NAD(P)-binding oxidoreductase [Acidimicrobiales bacterium]
MRDSVTIVGASLAGLRSAETLRRDGFGGRISLIGDEPHQPYDRPPLSKQVLAGDWEPERALLTPAEKLEPLGLDLRLGVRATGLDVAARELEVDGVAEPFDGLLIATGARCRTLPGTGSPVGVHTLRTLDDCLAIRAALDDGARRMVVIGAGFIGAEVASVAVGRGTSVTLVEALPAPFARVLGQEMGAVVADVHVANGVDLRCGVGVSSVAGEPGAMTVAMADGSDVYADLVVVGIGVVPNTEWLEGSGLTLDDGVVCDPTCLAAPNVVAAGDVARWTDPRTGESMRVEHWDNAVEQGRHAARRLLATDEEAEVFAPVPWFWSDQYDRKIQLAGRPHPDDEVRVVDGSTDERRFAAFYGRRGQLTAVLGMNRPRQVMQGRGLLEQGVGWDDALAVAAGWA